MKTLIQYAHSFLGKPYIWGGDDPILGFDCSGLVQELLASVGMDPPGDQTAHNLYMHFINEPHTSKAKAGSLAFFGPRPKVTHVGFMIDKWRMVEAGGGGSRTKTVADAAAQNAYIRIRPIHRRTDLIAIIHPNYSIGSPV